jgi:hypothetical protein
MMEGIVSMLPQLGGVIISSEPDLRLPGSGQAGIAHTLSVPGRLPADFPLGALMASSETASSSHSREKDASTGE